METTRKSKIEITTLEDIIKKVPMEDLETFITDLRAWLLISYNVEMLKAKLPVGMMLSTPTTMSWINDWKNDINTNVTVTTKNTDKTDT